MATETTNLGLAKPELEDDINASVLLLADNMDAIDTAVQDLVDGGGGGEGVSSINTPFFAYSGALTTGVSGRWYPANALRVNRYVGSLGTPGSTDTVLRMLYNGSPAGTLTIPSGEYVAGVDVTVDYAAETDYLQFEIITAGTDAADLLMELVAVPPPPVG